MILVYRVVTVIINPTCGVEAMPNLKVLCCCQKSTDIFNSPVFPALEFFKCNMVKS